MFTEGFGEMVEKLRRATVQVSAGRNGHGSGVVVKAEGVIVTNAHVAAFTPLEVTFWNGSRASAELQLRDVTRDLAILRVSRMGLTVARLADSDRLRIGEPVIAIGNPLGFIGALTTGIVRGVGVVPGLGVRKWIQSDVRLAPGNSGGPLANGSGVIGINTMIAGRLGLAVPSNSVARLLEQGPARAPLGATIRPVVIRVMGTEQTGLLVLEIAKSSAAEISSLMTGDILIGVDGKYSDAIEDFEEALTESGRRVIRLHFVRGDRSHIRTVAVRLGAESTAAA